VHDRRRDGNVTAARQAPDFLAGLEVVRTDVPPAVDDELRLTVDLLLFPENETNLLGYQLLQAGNVKDAIAVFQLNADGYPLSANVYDSLSDAYLEAGRKEEALKFARKALDALDKDPNATPQFKQQVRESAEGKIRQLQPVVK
jgi:tetratricopeptide (TPR) repeat protein